MTSAASASTHEWARSRLRAWAAGILETEDEERFANHLLDCAACRSVAESMGDLHTESAPDHIPSALLARWDRRASSIRGMLRGIVRGHLERCEICRSELQLLGFEPELPWVPELEAADDPAFLPAPRNQATPAWSGDARGLIARWRETWAARLVRWRVAFGATTAGALTLLAFAASAAVVTVAVIGLFRNPTQNGAPAEKTRSAVRLPNTTREPAPNGLTLPMASSPNHALLAIRPEGERAFALVKTYGANRSPQHPPYVSFDPQTRELSLIPPPALSTASGPRVEISIRNEGGMTLRSLSTTLDALFGQGGGRVIVVRQGAPELAPGLYTIRFEVRSGEGGSGPAEISSFGFQLR